MSAAQSADVAVIGGGVVGLACAVELARRRMRVVILERGRVGHGASFGNAGLLTPSLAFPLAQPGHFWKALAWMCDPEGPFYIRPRLDPALASWLVRFLLASRRSRFEAGARAMVELCRWSSEHWGKLALGGSEFGYQCRGMLMVFETEEAYRAFDATAAFTGELGNPSERWDADRVRAEEPGVIGPVLGARFFPRDSHCEPDRAVQALLAEAARLGVDVREHAEVVGVGVERGRVREIRTRAASIGASHVVLAAGAWSGDLGRAFGLRLRMRSAKGYSLLFPRGDDQPSRPIYLAERKVIATPHEHELRVAGTLEFVGDDLSINERRVAAISRGARAMLRVDAAGGASAPWSGLRPCLPDGMPVIGRSERLDNLWLATGHQMTGLKCAPGTGRLLAELLAGEPPSFDPAPFSPGRLGGSV